MAVRMTVDRNWSDKTHKNMQVGLLEFVTTVHERAIILAPKDTRALVNSGLIAPNRASDTYSLKFGSSKVPYARIQELGGKTGRGHSVSIIGKHYLERAAESVARGDTSKYFRSHIA